MGILDKITARAKKAAGDLTDDASLCRQGKREQRKGEKKEERDRARERADEKAEEVADLERKNLSTAVSGNSASPRSWRRSTSSPVAP
jgi:uncharacterized protein YjbJ (UPF0337 family)